MKRRLLAACFAATAVPVDSAWARLGGNASSDAIPWLRLVLGLVLCLGLAWAAALFLRSRAGGPTMQAWGRKPPRRLRLLETVRVGPQATLSLVTVDSAEYLLVSTSDAAHLTEYKAAGRSDDGTSA